MPCDSEQEHPLCTATLNSNNAHYANEYQLPAKQHCECPATLARCMHAADRMKPCQVPGVLGGGGDVGIVGEPTAQLAPIALPAADVLVHLRNPEIPLGCNGPVCLQFGAPSPPNRFRFAPLCVGNAALTNLTDALHVANPTVSWSETAEQAGNNRCP
jgi:hypothetical protein